MPDKPTRKDGRYILEERIGGNGLFDVYKAKDTVDNRIVCLKEWASGLGKSQDLDAPQSVISDGTAKEGQLYQLGSSLNLNLNHPAIQAAYEYFEEQEPAVLRQCLAAEYINGKNLKELLKEGWEPSEDEVITCAKEILPAMQYYHEQGIVHRDIKPSNIMWLENGSYKLIDFSVATNKVRGEDRSTVISTADNHSYQSLEIAQLWSEAEIRDDLYSFGLVLAEMVNGSLGFPDISEGQVSINTERIDLKNLINGLTGLFRSQRFSSPRQALISLEEKVMPKQMSLYDSIPEELLEKYNISSLNVFYTLVKNLSLSVIQETPSFLKAMASSYLPADTRDRREFEISGSITAAILNTGIAGLTGYYLTNNFGAAVFFSMIEFGNSLVRIGIGGDFEHGGFGHPILTVPYYSWRGARGLSRMISDACQEKFKQTKLELIKKQLPSGKEID